MKKRAKIVVSFDSSGELMVLWDYKRNKLFKTFSRSLYEYYKTGIGFDLRMLMGNNQHYKFIHR